MADPSKSMIGRRSRTVGLMFENMITSACNFYFDKGYAWIEKTPEPMRVLKPCGDRRLGQFIACYEKQAQPDFKGALCDGTMIIFDAKHTDTDRIQQSVISEAQHEAFEKYSKMGAQCFVVVSIGMASFYRVPWEVWKSMKEKFGHKYMAEGKELEDYRVPFTNLTVKFLEGVEIHDC